MKGIKKKCIRIDTFLFSEMKTVRIEKIAYNRCLFYRGVNPALYDLFFVVFVDGYKTIIGNVVKVSKVKIVMSACVEVFIEIKFLLFKGSVLGIFFVLLVLFKNNDDLKRNLNLK